MNLDQDLTVREGLQSFAKAIDKKLPYGWGFILLCFPFGEGGRMNYVSNAQRADVVRALQEFITATRGQWAHHEPELSAAAEDSALARARQEVARLEAELAQAMSLLGQAEGHIARLEAQLENQR